MAFDPYLDWVDVPNPAQPPLGAKMITASDLLRYEQGIEANEQDIATVAEGLNSKADLMDGVLAEAQVPTAVVQQVASAYLASNTAVVDAAAAAVDANPEINSMNARLGILDSQGQRGYVVSNTSGRTVSVWDYTNNREQLIYSNTGVRQLTIPNIAPLNGMGTLTIQRTNNIVTMIFDAVEYVGTNATEYLVAPGFIPVGFRPGYSENPTSVLTNANANAVYTIGVLQASRLRRMGPALTGPEPGTGVNALRGTIQWRTSDPWPSILPGTAVGTIPNT